MGSSSRARKKTGKSSSSKAWHRAYSHLNLPQMIVGGIPKRIRAIDDAKARLKSARTVKAAGVERRLLERSLTAIDGIYTKTRKALRDGGDMHRWNEFPGLEAAVKQVNKMGWSDLQGRGIPGGPVKYDIPKFDDGSSRSGTKVVRSNDVATGPNKNRDRIPKHIEDEVKVDSEDGQIKDKIKRETKDKAGVSLATGPPERLLPSESVTQPPIYQYGYPYQPAPSNCAHRAPLPVSHLDHPPNYWHALPYHYCQPSFPPFYPVMSYYNLGLLASGPDGSARGPDDPQFTTAPSHPPLQAFPQRLAVPTPPGLSPFSFLPPPSIPPPGLPIPSSTLSPEPSPAATPPSASPQEPEMAKDPESQQSGKRKFFHFTDSSNSAPSRTLKRRRPVASDFMFEGEGHQNNRTKHPLPANGLPDFGTWFQGQVTSSRKKLSQLKHGSTPTGNKKGS